MGHIDLPIPIYNPFLSQMYVLLRATCVYCHGFKVAQTRVHEYECKLKLIQYGLLPELTEFEAIVAQEAFSSNADSDSTLEDAKRIEKHLSTARLSRLSKMEEQLPVA